MLLRADMLNGHSTFHGSVITTLADSASGFACNSYNKLTIASGLNVDFVAPAFVGDMLTARATKVSWSSRTDVCDVMVFDQNGDCIAVF